MAILPVSHSLDAPPAETIEQRLRRLQAVWEEETCVLSNPDAITGHWAFQEIIGMGEPVIPLLLRDLEKEPHFWVWALPVMTGENPVQPSEGGNIRKMSEAWVKWGREKGYRW